MNIVQQTSTQLTIGTGESNRESRTLRYQTYFNLL